jgi:hypothetical protein
MAGKRKKALPPRRLRRKRSARLQAAGKWLAGFEGKHIARSYSHWFGVDRLCAIHELRMLGVQLDPNYIRAVEVTASQPRRRATRAAPTDFDNSPGEQDETFAMIIGRTEGGAPYGVTWEQWRLIQDE